MTKEERLVAGNPGHETSTARLEHKPGLACQTGIAVAQGAGLRNARFRLRFGRSHGRPVLKKPGDGQNWRAIPTRQKIGDFPNAR